jgi:hypothetical protein
MGFWRVLRWIVVPVLVMGLGVVAWWLIAHRRPAPPDIAFVPYQDGYETKVDFARLEFEHPLTPAVLTKVTSESLKGLDQERVNQLYARLTAGPIPDGPFRGDLFFPRGTSGEGRLAEIVGGVRGLGVELGTLKAEALGRLLWKGKVFYRDQHVLRNRIEDLALLRPVLGGDTDKIERLAFEDEKTWLLFPAKLHCGQSLLDGRRESIIIDYAFGDDIAGYREIPDFLAGRRGLQIRDEIRMVRPGFYLGRAYTNGVFLLNFTLVNEAIAARHTPAFAATGTVTEDCWVGTQRVADLPR